MVDVEGASYRKIVGPARFLHNDTYLLCDTALWNVETKIIEARDEPTLRSESRGCLRTMPSREEEKPTKQD